MPVHGAVEFAELGVGYVVAYGPHLPYSWHPLKQPQRAANTLTGSVRQTAQHRRGVPRVGVTVGKKPAIKDENSVYIRPAGRFATLSALKPTSPDRFDKIRTLRG